MPLRRPPVDTDLTVFLRDLYHRHLDTDGAYDWVPDAHMAHEQQLRAELEEPPALVDADEAARILGITMLAFRHRVQRGMVPLSAIVRTGRRVQFIRAKLPGVR
jgi:hypothetical protein